MSAGCKQIVGLLVGKSLIHLISLEVVRPNWNKG